MTYEKLSATLGNRSQRNAPTGTHTKIVRIAPDCIVVQHHSTDVVRAFADGRFILSSGGYRSMTTKERINHYGPEHVCVYQRDGVWFLNDRRDGSTVPFVDGVEVR